MALWRLKKHTHTNKQTNKTRRWIKQNLSSTGVWWCRSENDDISSAESVLDCLNNCRLLQDDKNRHMNNTWHLRVLWQRPTDWFLLKYVRGQINIINNSMNCNWIKFPALWRKTVCDKSLELIAQVCIIMNISRRLYAYIISRLAPVRQLLASLPSCSISCVWLNIAQQLRTCDLPDQRAVIGSRVFDSRSPLY